MADITQTTSTPCPTLCELSDIISAMQREINDLSVIVLGHTQDIGDQGSDIDDLQNPPTGVPIPLVEWYGQGHTTKEVDTLLATDLTTLSTASDANDESITVVSNNLDTEIADRTDSDIALQDTDVDLQTQVTDNLGTLTQEIADRSALSAAVSDQNDATNTRIDGVEADIAGLATAGDSASSSASAQLSAMNAALQVQQTQILQLQGIGVDPAGAQASQITALTITANGAATATAQETTDRKNADIALQASVNTLNSSIFGIQSGLDSEVSTRQDADARHDSQIDTLETSMLGFPGAISSETAQRIAADNAMAADIDAHTDSISANTAAIASEVTVRADADTGLQAQIDTNSSNISGNTSQITTNTTDITQIKGQFGVVKDVGGYVTDWQRLDQLTAPGDFNLRDLNNNARLWAPGYTGKYFAPIAVAAFSPTVVYDTAYGTGPATSFHGTDGNDYTRNVNVYATGTVGLNGSVFKGVNYGTGGDIQRLGQVVTTFLVDFKGAVHRYLSVWYRIKNTPTDTTQRWFPVAMADNTMAAQRTYEQAGGKVVVQISVTADKVIEFGVTVLNTLDASIADLTGNNLIYGASVSVTAINMGTVT